MPDDALGVILGFIALVFVFLPHWLDPLILMKEKREHWEERPAMPRNWGAVMLAVLSAILCAAVAAALLWIAFRFECTPCLSPQ